MTIAVCMRCGARKVGALTSCGRCAFAPSDHRDKARAMLMSDRHLPIDQLDAIAERIRAGLPVTLPDDAVAWYLELLEEGAPRSSKLPRVGVAVLVVAAVATLVYFLLRA